MKKKCTKCNKIKPLTEYSKATTSADGKAYQCKPCAAQTKKEWIKKNPDKYKAQLERRKTNPWYSNKANMAKKIQKQRDNRKNLTDSYIIQLVCSPGTSGEGIDPNTISKELIEAYRAQLMLKRALGKTSIKPTKNYE